MTPSAECIWRTMMALSSDGIVSNIANIARQACVSHRHTQRIINGGDLAIEKLQTLPGAPAKIQIKFRENNHGNNYYQTELIGATRDDVEAT